MNTQRTNVPVSRSPYFPARKIITSSHLTAPELVSHFEDFSNTLQYASAAPELVFERLVGNLSASFMATLPSGWLEHPNALQASQLANVGLTAKLHENCNVLKVSEQANERLTAQLHEYCSVLKAIEQDNESLTVKLQENRRVHKESELANKTLKATLQENSRLHQETQLTNAKLMAELAILKQNILVPGPAKVIGVKAAVKPNPVIGEFDTAELRDWNVLRPTNSKIISFEKAYTTLPVILVGLTAFGIAPNPDARVKVYTSGILAGGFGINIDSWWNTKLYGAGCMWLVIEADDLDFQYGHYYTRENHDWVKLEMHFTRKITFSRAFSAVPKAFATDLTATGFTLNVGSSLELRHFSAMGSWLAYPVDKPGVASGCFSTEETRSCARPQLSNSAVEAFQSGVFKQPPRLFLALNALHMDFSKDMTLQVNADNVSSAGMTWHLDAWNDTILYSAGASYIALR